MIREIVSINYNYYSFGLLYNSIYKVMIREIVRINYNDYTSRLLYMSMCEGIIRAESTTTTTVLVYCTSLYIRE